jgi:hypothetical protein
VIADGRCFKSVARVLEEIVDDYGAGLTAGAVER